MLESVISSIFTPFKLILYENFIQHMIKSFKKHHLKYKEKNNNHIAT
jgi:hypothetical protein